MTDLKMRSVQTPNAAKQLAADIAYACYNDEIRAIVADELLSLISSAPDRKRLSNALEASGMLCASFDRQYQD